MTSTAFSVAAIFLSMGLLVSCSTAPPSSTARDELTHKAMSERAEWQAAIGGQRVTYVPK